MRIVSGIIISDNVFNIMYPQSLLSFLYCWKIKELRKRYEEEKQTLGGTPGGTVVENEVALQQI